MSGEFWTDSNVATLNDTRNYIYYGIYNLKSDIA